MSRDVFLAIVAAGVVGTNSSSGAKKSNPPALAGESPAGTTASEHEHSAIQCNLADEPIMSLEIA
jgi:hypothetical protein